MISLLRSLRRLRTPTQAQEVLPFEDFSGSWEQALQASDGYNRSIILERVLAASLAVAEGRAVHERDSVLFDDIQYSWPVLAALMWATARSHGELRVIDVGGSLGSTYRQNRRFLAKLENVSWAVVEQPSFVSVGRQHLENDRLTFHSSICDAMMTRPHVALLSSVLQYLDDPWLTLSEVSGENVKTLVIDRTPVHDGSGDRLTIQHVPPTIYPVSYAARILSLFDLRETLERFGWIIVEEFTTLEKPMVTRGNFPFHWVGMICERRERGPEHPHA